MEPYLHEYDACRSNLIALKELYEKLPADRNEATTRLQLVDKLFFDCLGWDRNEGVELEHEQSGEYADYLFSTNKDVLIVEAKREGISFELPAGRNRLKYSLSSLMKDYPELKKAIKQVAGYCWERGVPYGAICNGHQIVAFVASRTDSVRPFDGDALVFPSLEFMVGNFLDLWQSLSKPGINANKLYDRLISRAVPDLPPKLSASLAIYPGTKNRNVFQTDLMNLSDIVLEDITRSESIEALFLRECYCSSDALSQYSQLSRDVLAARYGALFDEENPGPTTVPVRTRKGISPELFAESLSRRPILLLGDVGVGKTSFQRYLIMIEAPDQFKEAISLYINFGAQGTLSNDLKSFLVHEIERQLQDEYNINIYDRQFVMGVYDRELKNFSSSIYGDLEQSDPDRFADKKREHLEARLKNGEEHLRRSLEHVSRGRRKQIVIFLDNTDQRGSSDQEQAFLMAEEIATNWHATVYLPIRPETFHQSKKVGALSGYHAKAFTISPPRIDDVLEKRLNFALGITSGRIPLVTSGSQSISTTMTSLDTMIRVLLRSLKENADIIQLLDNIGHGNVRLVLDLVKQFLGSGHVDTEKICRVYRKTGMYIIPLHEFLRALMYGDAMHYDPTRSPFVNIFDIVYDDPKEHFIVPLIISYVFQLKTSSKSEGFVETQAVYAKIQSLGYTPDQIEHAIARCTDKKLLEMPARKIARVRDTLPAMIRPTSIGLYHVNNLARSFTYLDCISIDLPVLDPQMRREIRLCQGIVERVERVGAIQRYLDQCWKKLPSANMTFDWEVTSQALSQDIQNVLDSEQKQKRRHNPNN